LRGSLSLTRNDDELGLICTEALVKKWTSRPGGERSVRCDWRRRSSTWKNCSARRTGRDLRSAFSPDLRSRSTRSASDHDNRRRLRSGIVTDRRLLGSQSGHLGLAKGARQRGATILTETRVTGIRVERGRVSGVETDRGFIECEVSVNAGGIYAHEIGQLRACTCRSFPWPISTSSPKTPDCHATCPPCATRLARLLSRRERWAGGRGLRAKPRPVGSRRYASDFNNQLLPRTGTASPTFTRRPRCEYRYWPTLRSSRSSTVPKHSRPTVSSFSGPLPSPDSGSRRDSAHTVSPVLGGWDSSWRVDHRRLAGSRHLGDGLTPLRPPYRSRDFALARTYEVYATYYDVKFPGHERQAGRPLRIPPATSA